MKRELTEFEAELCAALKDIMDVATRSLFFMDKRTPVGQLAHADLKGAVIRAHNTLTKGAGL